MVVYIEQKQVNIFLWINKGEIKKNGYMGAIDLPTLFLVARIISAKSIHLLLTP